MPTEVDKNTVPAVVPINPSPPADSKKAVEPTTPPVEPELEVLRKELNELKKKHEAEQVIKKKTLQARLKTAGLDPEGDDYKHLDIMMLELLVNSVEKTAGKYLKYPANENTMSEPAPTYLNRLTGKWEYR